MFEILNSLFQSKNKKNSKDNSVENESGDKKKCKRCLRRVNFDYGKCSYCGYSEFYDD
jgi:hypothetical protein